MVKEQIAYLKNNPQGYWFKAKLYGWGWTPAKWQGWLVIFSYVSLIVALVLTREKISQTILTRAVILSLLPCR